MSAWLVSKEHVLFMAESGRRLHVDELSTVEQVAGMANLLWKTCLKSIKTRYPDDTQSITKIVPSECTMRKEPMSLKELAQLAKSIRCYQYQSCEFERFYKSKANKFCQTLQGYICNTLPGYDDAHWGGPNGE